MPDFVPELAGVALAVMLVAGAFSVILFVCFYLTLQRALSLVSPHNREMQPGMVWLNLIPVFGAVWIFITVIRVSGSLRKEFKERGYATQGSFGQMIGLAWLILTLGSLIPIPPVNLVCAAVGFICLLVYWVLIARYSAQLMEQGNVPSWVLALPIFAVTLFASAFLLFLVQPMIGKMILPKLGGTPQVWNTCMVFFQLVLLAGYAYTHFTTRIPLRRQLLLHGLLLLIPLVLILPTPLFPGGSLNYVRGDPSQGDPGWIPPAGDNPIPETLLILTLIVGVPFFVVSTSAPLLQKWFSHSGHPAAVDPYFLYAASNLGSMLSLVFYPFVVEPNLLLRQQAWTWVGGYALLIITVFACAALVWRVAPTVQLAGLAAEPKMLEEPAAVGVGSSSAVTTAPPPPVAPAPAAPKITGIQKGPKKRGRPGFPAMPPPRQMSAPVWEEKRSDEITAWRRIRWVLLAAVPSSMMLGVTSFISTDVSAIPLFWVGSLSLYLLSFILVFLRWPVPWTRGPHTFSTIIQTIFILLMVYIVVLTHTISPIQRSAGLSLVAFFLVALVCHGELARDRPAPAHLTEFFLLMSLGGAIGGMFNGLLAPVIFTGVVEFPLAIVLACLLRPRTHSLAPLDIPVGLVLGAVFGALAGVVFFLHSYTLLNFILVIVSAMLGLGVGAVLAIAYGKPSHEEGNWTESFLVSISPEMGNWFAKVGQDLARVFGKVVKPNSTYLLSLSVDVFYALVVAGYAALVLGFVDASGVYKTLAAITSKEIAENLYRPVTLLMHYGIPLVLCFIYSSRPLRIGLVLGAVLLVNNLMEQRSRTERLLAAKRSYFGVLRVWEKTETNEDNEVIGRYTYLMHGTTHHGLNYHEPKTWHRLATTYYHHLGPAGIVMDKFNWFKLKYDEKKYNSTFAYQAADLHNYTSDLRMPASLIGLGGGAPLDQLVGLWSEPPYATIGLGTGTMASYARPFQHMHFYEIDKYIRQFSLPEDDSDPPFIYLMNAKKRGAELRVLMGDARVKMAQPYENGGGPDHFYHMMVVDAFSSDAIPVHLITKEALELYFTKLAPRAILCVHTSNRHIDLVPEVANVARVAEWDVLDDNGIVVKDANGKPQKKTGLVAMRAHDSSPYNFRGHFTSEWVMVARSWEDLKDLKAPIGYEEHIKEGYRRRRISEEDAERIVRREPYWMKLTFDRDGDLIARWGENDSMKKTLEGPLSPWTDDYSNVIRAFR